MVLTREDVVDMNFEEGSYFVSDREMLRTFSRHPSYFWDLLTRAVNSEGLHMETERDISRRGTIVRITS